MDRRLCAIMFTDIQGYTKLMQESEQKAIETRYRHRSVFDPLTRQYGGKNRNFNGVKLWTPGYAVLTVGFELEKVKQYIAQIEKLEKELAQIPAKKEAVLKKYL